MDPNDTTLEKGHLGIDFMMNEHLGILQPISPPINSIQTGIRKFYLKQIATKKIKMR